MEKKKSKKLKGGKESIDETSSTFKLGFNAYLNPILRSKGKRAAYKLFAKHMFVKHRTVKRAWYGGWEKAEKLKATAPLEINGLTKVAPSAIGL